MRSDQTNLESTLLYTTLHFQLTPKCAILFRLTTNSNIFIKTGICKKCSRRFHTFIQDLLKILIQNTLDIFVLRHRNIHLRKDDKNFKDGIQFLLSLLQDFKDALSDKIMLAQTKLKISNSYYTNKLREFERFLQNPSKKKDLFI